MEILILKPQKEYELLDSGEGEKLERFGNYTLSRPDPNAVWPKKQPISQWNDADAVFMKEKSVMGNKWKNKGVKEPWTFEFDGIKMILKLTPFKHTGLFPEQILNWQWFGQLIKEKVAKDSKNSVDGVCQVSHDREILDKEGCGKDYSGRRDGDGEKNGDNKKDNNNCPNVLNLFGYTGGATLYAASCGAKVTHVDASKPSVTWARENQTLSNLENKSIRWIVDDAKKFVAREVKRGAKYDGIIMDPPSFGRDPKGKVFKFEQDVPELLKLCKQLLLTEPLFFLINSYAMGYSPTVIKNMLAEILPIEKIKCGELQIQEKDSKRSLPTSVFARYSR